MSAIFGYWLPLICFFLSANSLAAVLYAGVEGLDPGTGFISFSPFMDCILWGSLMALSAVLFGIWVWRRRRRGEALPRPSIRPALRFPAAYGAALALLSLAVLAMGAAGLFDPYGPVHLPFWGYAALLALAYPLLGFLLGRRMGGRPLDALWGAAIAGLLLALGMSAATALDAQDTVYARNPHLFGTYVPRYTGHIMDTAVGGALGRVSLPAGVLLGGYEHAYYDGAHAFSRTGLCAAACLLPPLLFSGGWLAACLTGRGSRRNKEGEP